MAASLEEFAPEILAEIQNQIRLHPGVPFISSGGKPSINGYTTDALIGRGIRPETARSRMKSVRKGCAAQVQAIMDGITTPAQEAEKPPAKERTLDEDVALSRAKESAAGANKRLKGATERIIALEDALADYEALAKRSPRPAEWTLRKGWGSRLEHIPLLFSSDAQVGEVIRPEETDCAHGYDAGTYRRRYRTMIESTIHLCRLQSEFTYPGIIYSRGGDTISGGIHEELAETDDLTPIEAVEVAFEEEAGGILKLADEFGRVDVKSVGGNHDRNTARPRSKGRHAHSYDRLVEYMLRREFMRDDRVTFQSSESPDCFFPVYNTNILLTHGDNIGSSGGQGFIGPAATIMRGAQKILMEQNALGRRVDEVHVGHFHTALQLGYALANGCFPGYSEYAKGKIRPRPEAPSQWLVLYHPDLGPVSWKKVWLEKPSSVSGAQQEWAATA